MDGNIYMVRSDLTGYKVLINDVESQYISNSNASSFNNITVVKN